MCSIPHTVLTLKSEYRKSFVRQAKLKFPRGYIIGVWRAINERLDPEEPQIQSDDTIRRILTIEGYRGSADNVNIICEFFEKGWQEACVEGEILSGADDYISRIRQKITFDFLSQSRGSSTQSQNQWIDNSFIELSLIEVEALPSEYPLIADPSVLVDSSNLTDDDFDRIGVQLLRGHKRKIKDVISERHNIFIYGDPGSGKTTCLQWVALKCRQGEILPAFIPIFIGARSFATIGQNETLQDQIDRMFDEWECSSAERKEILQSGQAVFIFDGIDEVASQQRERIENNIERLLWEHPKCRFIFSSRLGREYTFSKDFQKAIIAPLQGVQIRLFVENWFAQSGKDKTLAKQMISKLRSNDYRGIRELSQRPILLDLLCVVFENNADLPHKRFDVFRKGIDLMTRKNILVEDGGPSFKTLRELDVQNILCGIANYFFLKCQIIFPTQDVERGIQKYYKKVYQIDQSLVPGRKILQSIEQSNGLLVRWADNFCTFSHLTYQEFFTADYLVRNDRYQEVYQYLEKPRWHFVIGLISERLSYETLWQFFCEFKRKIDSIISDDPKLIAFLETVDKRAKSTAALLESKQPNLEIYARAWYFVYALKDPGNVTNTGAIYRYFDLPDFELATSMIDGKSLELDECFYKIYHDFDKGYETPESFIAALNRLERLLQNDHQKAEVIKGWFETIRRQRGDFADIAEWWFHKYDYWRACIIRYIQTLRLPFVEHLTQEQKDKLHSYYSVTKLFSTCMTRSQLDTFQREEVVGSMLLLRSLVVEN